MPGARRATPLPYQQANVLANPNSINQKEPIVPKILSRAQLNALPGECRKPVNQPQQLAFRCQAYALGQFCLPYAVNVTHKKTRHG